jgi:hypothetical protein
MALLAGWCRRRVRSFPDSPAPQDGRVANVPLPVGLESARPDLAAAFGGPCLGDGRGTPTQLSVVTLSTVLSQDHHRRCA